MSGLLQELVFRTASRTPSGEALRDGGASISYEHLAQDFRSGGNLFLELGLERFERVAVYLEKRYETVSALFSAITAGGVFVPVNPLLKA